MKLEDLAVYMIKLWGSGDQRAARAIERVIYAVMDGAIDMATVEANYKLEPIDEQR